LSAAALNSLRDFTRSLAGLPTTVATKVAAAAAPAITDAARATFDASTDAYGVPWASGAEGQTVTLKDTGTLASTIRYVAIGTKLRVALGTAYAKYQVGRRPVTPRQGDPLPAAYRQALASAAAKVIREELGGGK